MSNEAIFTPEEQRRLQACLEHVRFMPRGVLADIARTVGCTRQFVQLVLYSEDTFTKYRSESAQHIWEAMKKIVEDRPDIIKQFEHIARTLEAGDEVTVGCMTCQQRRSLSRKLRMIGTAFKEEVSGPPGKRTYKFTPVKVE